MSRRVWLLFLSWIMAFGFIFYFPEHALVARDSLFLAFVILTAASYIVVAIDAPRK